MQKSLLTLNTSQPDFISIKALNMSTVCPFTGEKFKKKHTHIIDIKAWNKYKY